MWWPSINPQIAAAHPAMAPPGEAHCGLLRPWWSGWRGWRPNGWWPAFTHGVLHTTHVAGGRELRLRPLRAFWKPGIQASTAAISTRTASTPTPAAADMLGEPAPAGRTLAMLLPACPETGEPACGASPPPTTSNYRLACCGPRFFDLSVESKTVAISRWGQRAELPTLCRSPAAAGCNFAVAYGSFFAPPGGTNQHAVCPRKPESPPPSCLVPRHRPRRPGRPWPRWLGGPGAMPCANRIKARPRSGATLRRWNTITPVRAEVGASGRDRSTRRLEPLHQWLDSVVWKRVGFEIL